MSHEFDRFETEVLVGKLDHVDELARFERVRDRRASQVQYVEQRGEGAGLIVWHRNVDARVSVELTTFLEVWTEQGLEDGQHRQQDRRCSADSDRSHGQMLA